MSFAGPPPLIWVRACLVDRDGFGYHQVGDKYAASVVDGAGGLPVLIPALGAKLDLEPLLDHLDGLLITGSPSNVEPHHYDGPPQPEDSPRDPARDSTTLPLITRALARGVPLFAICRGIQELNVVLGGTLHQELHVVEGRRDHRSDKSVPLAERYGPVHRVRLTPGGLLQQLLGGVEEIEVNSLHGQAIDRLAPGLALEAVADDGTIEAVRVPGAPAFALAVQWYPEWRVLDNPISRRLYAAFGEACRARADARTEHERDRADAARQSLHRALAAGT